MNPNESEVGHAIDVKNVKNRHDKGTTLNKLVALFTSNVFANKAKCMTFLISIH